MGLEQGRFSEFLRRVTQGLPFEAPTESRDFWVARFGDLDLQIHCHDPNEPIPGGLESEACPTRDVCELPADGDLVDEVAFVDLSMELSDPECCWQLRLEELAEDPAAQRRQATSWRSTVMGVRSLEGVVERALAEAVAAAPEPVLFAELPAPPLGFFPGEQWVSLYVDAWHRLGQPITVEWLESVDQRLSQLSSELPLAERVQLSRALWRAGADYLHAGPLTAGEDAELVSPDEGWGPGREIPEGDPGTKAHRVFLKAALQGRNLVRPHYRPWPAEAVALIDHDETQCSVSIDVNDEVAFVCFRAQLKQGWIGKDFPPTFYYEERVKVSDLEDTQSSEELGRRLRAMDDAWSSRRAIAKTAENEASGKTALFRRGKPVTTDWAYFSVLAQALDGRKVTPRWIDNVGLKFGRWAATAAGPAGSAAAELAYSHVIGAATGAGITAIAAQQGVIPTNRPHAFADR